jgi:hypothetical protein
MIVLLRAELFTQQNTLALLAIFQHGTEDRHVIITYPVDGKELNPVIISWLESLPLGLQKTIQTVIDYGKETQLLPDTLRLVVTQDPDGSKINDRGWPHVSLVDGLRLLRTTLTAILENRFGDRAFLTAIALPEHKSKLNQAVKEGWLCFESSGGIEQLVKRLKIQTDEATRPSRERKEASLAELRWWCLCDRDNSSPTGLSPNAQSVETARRKFLPELPYGPLQRRTIENYLPMQIIQHWAEEPSDAEEKSLRLQKVQAWEKLPPSLRARFAMKKGLLWGLSKERKTKLCNAPQMRVNVSEFTKAFSPANPDEQNTLRELHKDHSVLRALQEGFGDQIGSLFAHPRLQESWVQDEVTHEERFDLLQSLLARL